MKLLVTSLLIAMVAIPHSTLELRQPDPSDATLGLKIDTILPDGRIDVSLENLTQRTVRIWRWSNSWGADRWRVLRISGGKLQTFIENPHRIFSRNIPGYDELSAGAKMSFTFDLNSSNWGTRGTEPVKFERGDIIIVVYDVPWMSDVRDLNVWNGVTTALGSVP